MVDFLHQSLAALCVENFEIFFQISQYSLLGEKVGNLFSCHIVLMLVLLHAESHKENLVQFFILRHDLLCCFLHSFIRTAVGKLLPPCAREPVQS